MADISLADLPQSPTGEIDTGSASQQSSLGKRKRDEEFFEIGAGNGDGYDGEDDNEDSLFMPMGPEDEFMPPETDHDMDDEDLHLDELDSDADSEDDQGPLMGMTHDQTLEPFPEHSIFDEDIRDIQTRLTQIPQNVLNILAEFDCRGKHVLNQRQAAEALLSVPKTRKPRIGLLGDAGAGKSSLLNSITDIDDLAKSLSAGQSCTCVPSEYSSPFEKQTKDFAASIRYFDIKKIRALLGEMLNEYNIYAFEYDPQWDEETRNTYKRKHQNALKTFMVLFCDLDFFSNKQAATAFLSEKYGDGEHDVVELMVESCEKKLKNKIEIGTGYAEFVEAKTRSKLRELVDPLMGAKPNNGQPALWPLVKQVCIGVRGSRILDHVTIVDLPGISDTNTIRVELCKEYIKNCDHLWVVAPIRRVIDDGSVDHLLATYGKIFQDRIAVVATHTDSDVDRKLANELSAEGEDMSQSESILQELKAKKKEVTAANQALKSARQRKRQTKPMLIQAQELEEALKQRKTEQLRLEQDLFSSLVAARASYVCAALKRDMTIHMPKGKQPPVFCISSTHYAALKGTYRVQGPRLDAEATGIPALRSHALTQAAPGLLRTLEAYVNHAMPSFLKRAHMWVNITSVEQRAELLEIVAAPEKALESSISQHMASCSIAINASVLRDLRARSNSFIGTALRKLKDKEKKHPSTILAFLRKYGSHQTKICPKEVWNEDFSRDVILVVGELSGSWTRAVEKNLEKTKDRFIADLRGILKELKAQPSAQVLPMQRFEDLIDTQIQGVENAFEASRDEYMKGIRNIQLDMTQDSEKNYFSKAMRPAYEACQRDKGPGIVKRSLQSLQEHISSTGAKGPFPLVEQGTQKAFVRNDTKHLNSKIKPRVEKIYRETFQAFDRMIDKTVEDPTEQKARLALLCEIGEIQEAFDSAVADLEDIKAKYACTASVPSVEKV